MTDEALQRELAEAVGRLNVLLAKVRRTKPSATYYLTPGALHVVDGPSHEMHTGRARREAVLATAHVARAGGGDW